MTFSRFSLGCLVGIVTQLCATLSWADSYRVGINDLLTVQIAVWDEVNATVVEMPGISGSYPVGADGEISVPLAGSLTAADLTTAEIAQALEAAMASYVGIGQTSKVAVSVESYAPIYVAGQIEVPGVYDYAPGLTVLKAVSLAGGLGGIKPTEGEERNFLTARGTISVLQSDLMFLTAKRDRLMAEMSGSALGEADSEENQTARAAEAAILDARNARYEQELASLAEARASLEEALGVLEDKLSGNRSQLEAAQEELEREKGLVERGLAASTRIFDRTTYVSELESRLLDIERSILLARQELQEHEREETQLLGLRHEENATTLQEVETNIAEVEAQLVGQYDLLAASAGQQIGQAPAVDPLSAEVSYVITRIRGGADTLPGDPSTTLMPGDVVEVILEDPNAVTPSN